MSYRLSLLDKSPIAEGASAAEALASTVEAAEAADRLGYHRYWIAEHHGNPNLASSAPEVVVAHILARTRRIRVGTGGVMLQHYAPYKVAEVFRVLAALSPGRVDLGIGKAPGGLPFSTLALKDGRDGGPPDFERQLADLDAFLGVGVPSDHRLAGALAFPEPRQAPERILLGAGVASAELAARQGWLFCHAGHLNGDPAEAERSFAAYEAIAGRNPLLAVFALVAETGHSARRQVENIRIFKAHLPGGRAVNLPSLEAVDEFARQAGVRPERVEENRPEIVAGTPGEVHAALAAIQRRLGVEEFVIDTPVADFAARLASIELLAGQVRPLAA
ncbi:LLM class flavin-dependent oxidoreductase [Aureimonas leprariae]|uniref:LLM class flavin-dependent oxidoreductase n=1 Tax=Plantimonas leprariae TaxID=2615207 RepID=A0A7V7TV91_9HYPH|nr:LLM class flavin-dependent oxidoreductase [Aureimonas leprariae]KAB0677514.1 LLM class flavin-dependent oxidoreductase [Aureimonas leprariae]